MNDISIVIPAYNEAENLEILCRKINDIMSELDKTYEVIFVEGGSSDGSFDVLLDLKKQFIHLKIS